MKKRSGFRESVWARDTSGLPVKAEYLKKRSTTGSWQKRFFVTNNSHLNYYSSQKMDNIRASIDLRQLTDAPRLVDRFGEFSLQLQGGDREYKLKADNAAAATEWVDLLEQRRQFYLAEAAKQPGNGDADADESADEDVVGQGDVAVQALASRAESDLVASIDSFAKEGVLQKKSPSRFKAWQDRYFKLMNGSLYYYKSQKSSSGDYIGEIVLDCSCVVKDGADVLDKPSSKVFIVETKYRAFELQAASVAEKEAWLGVLVGLQNHLRLIEENVKQRASEEEQLKIKRMQEEHERLRQPPEWIQKVDKLTNSEKLQKIQQNLDEKFSDCDGDLVSTCNAATSLIEEITDMARECLPSSEGRGAGGTLTEAGRDPRVDVFQFHFKFYHMRLVQEISLFVLDQKFKHSSSQDILRLIDLIVAYNEKLDEIFSGDEGSKLRDMLGQTFQLLMDNVQHMTELYIDKLNRTLGTWVDNIVSATLSGNTDRIQRRSNNQVETPSPIDLFNMINETMVLACSSGVESLIAAALSTCLVVAVDYMNHLIEDIAATEGARSLEFICALTNDCWTVTEQVNLLEAAHGNIAREYGIDFASVHSQFNGGAMKLLDKVVNLVLGDLEELNNMLFTPKHLKPETDALADDVVARIAATVEDYLMDLNILLDRPYFVKVSQRCIGREIVQYNARMLKLVAATGVKSLFSADGIWKIQATDVERVRQDQQRFKDCLLSTMDPHADANRLFRAQFLLQDDVLDMLCVTPTFFPASLLKICNRESQYTRDFVLFVADCCMRLRADLSGDDVKEIEEACKSVVGSIGSSSPGKGGQSSEGLEMNPYVLLWSALKQTSVTGGDAKPTKDNVQQQMLKKLQQARSKLEGKSPQEKLITSSPQPSSGSSESGSGLLGSWFNSATPLVATRPAARRSVVGTAPGKKSTLNAPTDISDEASKQRREERRQEILARQANMRKSDDVSDVDVELHGYLEKKNQQGLWQRRWFILRKLYDHERNAWRLALVWHQDHVSPPKSHLYVDDIVSVTIKSTTGVALKPDGVTYVLKKSSGKKKKVQDHEFKIVCKNRIYPMRAQSIHETITWVNGLKRVCVQNIPRPGNSLPISPEYQKLMATSISKLRGMCAAKSLDTSTCTEKKDLVDLLLSRTASATGAPSAEKIDTRSVQDQQKIADDVWNRERTRIVSLRSIGQLRRTCLNLGLDISRCVEKGDLVKLLLEHSSKQKGLGRTYSSTADSDVASSVASSRSQEDKGGEDEPEETRSRVDSVAAELEANVRSVIGKGYVYIEEGMHFEAMAMFDKAVREAQCLENRLLEAHALAGLGTAYLETEERASAAPMMFEMAASYYKEAGEKSGFETSLVDAANAFMLTGFPDEAIKCLERGGGDEIAIFKRKMESIKASSSSKGKSVAESGKGKEGVSAWKRTWRMFTSDEV